MFEFLLAFFRVFSLEDVRPGSVSAKLANEGEEDDPNRVKTPVGG